MDDILVNGKSAEEYLHNLESVLGKLELADSTYGFVTYSKMSSYTKYISIFYVLQAREHTK